VRLASRARLCRCLASTQAVARHSGRNRPRCMWTVSFRTLALAIALTVLCAGMLAESCAFAWPTQRLKRGRNPQFKPSRRGKSTLMQILHDPYTPKGKIRWAVQLMQRQRFFTTSFEYVSAMIALTNAGYNRDALTLFSEMRGRGMELDRHASSAAIVALQARGEWEQAIGTLQELFLHGLAPNSKGCEKALAAIEQGGKWELGLQVMEEMWAAGYTVDERTFMPAIRACENAAEFEVGEKLFTQMRTQMQLKRQSASAAEAGKLQKLPDEAPKAAPTPWRVPGAPAADAFESPWEKIQKKRQAQQEAVRMKRRLRLADSSSKTDKGLQGRSSKAEGDEKPGKEM